MSVPYISPGRVSAYFLSSGNEKWDIRELLKNIYWKQENISAIMNTGDMDWNIDDYRAIDGCSNNNSN